MEHLLTREYAQFVPRIRAVLQKKALPFMLWP